MTTDILAICALVGSGAALIGGAVTWGRLNQKVDILWQLFIKGLEDKYRSSNPAVSVELPNEIKACIDRQNLRRGSLVVTWKLLAELARESRRQKVPLEALFAAVESYIQDRSKNG